MSTNFYVLKVYCNKYLIFNTEIKIYKIILIMKHSTSFGFYMKI